MSVQFMRYDNHGLSWILFPFGKGGRRSGVFYGPQIKTFRYVGLARFYRSGSKAGIQPRHDKKLRTQLSAFTFEGADVVLLDYEDDH